MNLALCHHIISIGMNEQFPIYDVADLLTINLNFHLFVREYW